jgi:hypothetical protein
MGGLYQSGVGGLHVWTVNELAPQLTSFRVYPPELNRLDGYARRAAAVTRCQPEPCGCPSAG